MISVVILTWNSGQYMRRCLESLLADLKNENLNFEIFVFDNGSRDNTKDILEEFGSQNFIKPIFFRENRGTTYSRNIALERTKGEFILILDADTEVLPGAITTLVETLKASSNIALVAPQLRYPDSSIQQSYKKFPTVLLKFFKAMPLPFLRRFGVNMESYSFQPEKSEMYLVDYCISACWLMRREVVEQIGFFDERIFYAPEDVDYCLRIWLAGLQVAYCPRAQVIHYAQRMTYRDRQLAREHVKGLWYYFRKYGYWFSREKLYDQIRRAIDGEYPMHS